jgi:hypothetical protein
MCLHTKDNEKHCKPCKARLDKKAEQKHKSKAKRATARPRLQKKLWEWRDEEMTGSPKPGMAAQKPLPEQKKSPTPERRRRSPVRPQVGNRKKELGPMQKLTQRNKEMFGDERWMK